MPKVSYRLPLTRLQFREALEKGLGRAVLHARAHGLGQYLPELRRACLRPLAYDPQCESDRGRWLWTVIESAGAGRLLRATILRSLTRTRDDYTGVQLCQLVAGYAASGDPEARVALWRAFSQTIKGYRLAQEDILRVEGSEGYLKMLRLLAAQLPDDDIKDAIEGAIWYAEDLLGKDEAQRLLLSETGFAEVRTISRSLNQARPAPKWFDWAKLKAEIAGGADPLKVYNRFRPTDTADASRALEFALATPDEKIRLTLLRRLARNARVVPDYDARLWAVARSKNRLLRYQSVGLLGRMRHVEVRARALRTLESPRRFLERGPDLFRSNYRDEDGPKILSVLLRARTSGERHCATNIERIGDDVAFASLRKAYMAAYDLSPCEICRESLTVKLQRLGPLPTWIDDEVALNSENTGRSVGDK